MKRALAATAVLVLVATAAADRESVRPDLVRELLRRRPEWPGVQVEIPVEVYEAYVRDLRAVPVPPQPPEVSWIERVTYRIWIAGDDAKLEVEFHLVFLPGEGAKSLSQYPPVGPRLSEPPAGEADEGGDSRSRIADRGERRRPAAQPTEARRNIRIGS